MSESFPLPTEPEGVIPSLLERFNSGKVEAMIMATTAPDPVLVQQSQSRNGLARIENARLRSCDCIHVTTSSRRNAAHALQ